MDYYVKERFIEGFTPKYIIEDDHITIINQKDKMYNVMIDVEFLDENNELLDLSKENGFDISIENQTKGLKDTIHISKSNNQWTGSINYSLNTTDDIIISAEDISIGKKLFTLNTNNVDLTENDIDNDHIYKNITFILVLDTVEVKFIAGDKAMMPLEASYIIPKEAFLKEYISKVPELILKEEYTDEFLFAEFSDYDENKRPMDYECTDSLLFHASYIKPNIFIASTGTYSFSVDDGTTFSSSEKDPSIVHRYYHKNLTEDSIFSLDVKSESPAGFKMIYILDDGRYRGTDENWWIQNESKKNVNFDGYQKASVIEEALTPLNWATKGWPEKDTFKWIWSNKLTPNNVAMRIKIKSAFEAILKYNKNHMKAIGSMNDEIRLIGSRFNLSNNKFSLEGYEFVGWTTDQENNTRLFTPSDIFIMPIAEETIVYAKWNANQVVSVNPVDEEIIIDTVPKAPLNYKDNFAYIKGYPDHTIRPNANITRAEAAAVFYRLLDTSYKKKIKTTWNNFNDVDSSNWYNTYVSTLSKAGIISGYSDGSFKPNNYITRAELSVMASKFDELIKDSKSPFSDIKGHWAEKYIASAAEKGWVSGYKNGTFRPNKLITRAEFITLVNHVLNRRVYTKDILKGSVEFSDLKDTSLWFYNDIKIATNSYLYKELANGYQKWIEFIKFTNEM